MPTEEKILHPPDKFNIPGGDCNSNVLMEVIDAKPIGSATVPSRFSIKGAQGE